MSELNKTGELIAELYQFLGAVIIKEGSQMGNIFHYSEDDITKLMDRCCESMSHLDQPATDCPNCVELKEKIALREAQIEYLAKMLERAGWQYDGQNHDAAGWIEKAQEESDMSNSKKNLGEILVQRNSPELSPCDCGRMPVLVRRAEGMVNVWRVECGCGVVTSACLGQIQAVVKWEKQQSTKQLRRREDG